MPSRIVKLEDNYYYHIYNRVIEDKKLFYSTENYIFYLKLWNDIDFSNTCKVIAYCLMPTHYHYLLKIKNTTIFTKKISYLFNRYLKSLNTVRHEKGQYFRNRFKAKLIDDEKYLIQLCYYIHLNPLKSGIVKSLDDWPFSNYLAFIGKRNGKLIDQEFYREYIQSAKNYRDAIKTISFNKDFDKYIFEDE
jgi:putative transposase